MSEMVYTPHRHEQPRVDMEATIQVLSSRNRKRRLPFSAFDDDCYLRDEQSRNSDEEIDRYGLHVIDAEQWLGEEDSGELIDHDNNALLHEQQSVDLGYVKRKMGPSRDGEPLAGACGKRRKFVDSTEGDMHVRAAAQRLVQWLVDHPRTRPKTRKAMYELIKVLCKQVVRVSVEVVFYHLLFNNIITLVQDYLGSEKYVTVTDEPKKSVDKIVGIVMSERGDGGRTEHNGNGHNGNSGAAVFSEDFSLALRRSLFWVYNNPNLWRREGMRKDLRKEDGEEESAIFNKDVADGVSENENHEEEEEAVEMEDVCMTDSYNRKDEDEDEESLDARYNDVGGVSPFSNSSYPHTAATLSTSSVDLSSSPSFSSSSSSSPSSSPRLHSSSSPPWPTNSLHEKTRNQEHSRIQRNQEGRRVPLASFLRSLEQLCRYKRSACPVEVFDLLLSHQMILPGEGSWGCGESGARRVNEQTLEYDSAQLLRALQTWHYMPL